MTTEKKQKLPRLTKKQKDFAKAYLETGNGRQAALKAYDTDSPNTAGALASENLTKPNIRAYLESKAEKAAEFVYELAEGAENETVRLNASKDILDRSGFKVPEIVPPVSTNVTTYNVIFSAEVREKVQAMDAQIKAALMKPKHVTEETN